jgi:TPR repeat protein
LGLLYLEGKTIVHNEIRAIYWLNLAAEQESHEAYSMLSHLYDGNSIGDSASALNLKWVMKAAEIGDSEAQLKLGSIYFQGNGLPVDKSQAINLFNQSANQGNADAQYILGLLFESGNGVSHDDYLATKWFVRAADQGQKQALMRLGFYQYIKYQLSYLYSKFFIRCDIYSSDGNILNMRGTY